MGDPVDASFRSDNLIIGRFAPGCARLLPPTWSGTPRHPSELNGHACLGYAYRARSNVWRFTNDADRAGRTGDRREALSEFFVRHLSSPSWRILD
jgi:hypothetical protein